MSSGKIFTSSGLIEIEAYGLGEHLARELVDRPAVLQIVLDAVDVEA